MFSLRVFTSLSVKEIGQILGVTASAVSKAHKAVGARLAMDADLAARLRMLAGRFKQRPASSLGSGCRTAQPPEEADAVCRR